MAQQKFPRVRTLDEVIENFGPSLEALNSQSDLVCAIVLTSYLNDAVGALLHQHFVQNEKGESSTRDAVLKPDRGTLGSLRAKGDVAYCIGLVSKGFMTNLVKIAEIRNVFAHFFEEIAFDHPEIAGLCSGLLRPKVTQILVPETEEMAEIAEAINYGTPRRIFRTVCSSMCTWALMDAKSIERRTVKRDHWDEDWSG
jgi:DNA-binding MltR family transcriptional regulator